MDEHDPAERPAAAPRELWILRCAVALLVDWADRGHPADRVWTGRAGAAVACVRDLGPRADQATSIAAHRLVSPDGDPNGERAVGALADLAVLNKIDPRSAPALAASFATVPLPGQGVLFEDGTPPDAVDAAADAPVRSTPATTRTRRR